MGYNYLLKSNKFGQNWIFQITIIEYSIMIGYF